MARETWVQSQVESYQRLKKMVLDASWLNTQHYKVRIKGKVEQSRKGVAPSPTHWCSSYRKGSLRVTLDYGFQLYFTFIYIYIYIYGPQNTETSKKKTNNKLLVFNLIFQNDFSDIISDMIKLKMSRCKLKEQIKTI